MPRPGFWNACLRLSPLVPFHLCGLGRVLGILASSRRAWPCLSPLAFLVPSCGWPWPGRWCLSLLVSACLPVQFHIGGLCGWAWPGPWRACLLWSPVWVALAGSLEGLFLLVSSSPTSCGWPWPGPGYWEQIMLKEDKLYTNERKTHASRRR